jgi:hypothetical protein
LQPTFNSYPIRANSSERIDDDGIVAERATAYRDSFDDATLARITELAGDRYERAAALA